VAITNEQRLGIDIRIDSGQTEDLLVGSSSDFKTVSGNDNLAQAIVNRLRTAVGELELHPNYGSRLPSLIGTNPDDFTLPLARQHIRESLQQEPRIKNTGTKVRANFTDANKTVINCEIKVVPIDSEVAINIIWPFFITGEA